MKRAAKSQRRPLWPWIAAAGAAALWLTRPRPSATRRRREDVDAARRDFEPPEEDDDREATGLAEEAYGLLHAEILKMKALGIHADFPPTPAWPTLTEAQRSGLEALAAEALAGAGTGTPGGTPAGRAAYLMLNRPGTSASVRRVLEGQAAIIDDALAARLWEATRIGYGPQRRGIPTWASLSEEDRGRWIGLLTTHGIRTADEIGSTRISEVGGRASRTWRFARLDLQELVDLIAAEAAAKGPRPSPSAFDADAAAAALWDSFLSRAPGPIRSALPAWASLPAQARSALASAAVAVGRTPTIAEAANALRQVVIDLLGPIGAGPALTALGL